MTTEHALAEELEALAVAKFDARQEVGYFLPLTLHADLLDALRTRPQAVLPEHAELADEIERTLRKVERVSDTAHIALSRETVREILAALSRPSHDRELLIALLGEIRTELPNLSMLIDSVKQEWAAGGHWSEWDQQRKDAVHRFLALIDAQAVLKDGDQRGTVPYDAEELGEERN